jgi:hypothetical protein
MRFIGERKEVWGYGVLGYPFKAFRYSSHGFNL